MSNGTEFVTSNGMLRCCSMWAKHRVIQTSKLECNTNRDETLNQCATDSVLLFWFFCQFQCVEAAARLTHYWVIMNTIGNYSVHFIVERLSFPTINSNDRHHQHLNLNLNFHLIRQRNEWTLQHDAYGIFLDDGFGRLFLQRSQSEWRVAAGISLSRCGHLINSLWRHQGMNRITETFPSPEQEI